MHPESMDRHHHIAVIEEGRQLLGLGGVDIGRWDVLTHSTRLEHAVERRVRAGCGLRGDLVGQSLQVAPVERQESEAAA